MDIITGYEYVNTVPPDDGAGGGFLPPPPSYQEATVGEPPERAAVANLPAITDDEARAALLEEVRQHCCWGAGAAKNLIINDIKQSTAFKYSLETFGESRSTAWAFEPFRGQPIDGCEYGPAPGPWDISCPPVQLFANNVKKLEIPHTASVKSCHDCGGAGTRQCRSCFGRGQSRCTFCNGSGHQMITHHDEHHHDHHHNHHHHHDHHHSARCTWCHGSGWRQCHTCRGSGVTRCRCCDGTGRLKMFIQLTVKFQNHFEDFIDERTELPPQLLRDVTGKQVVNETGQRVYPLVNFPLVAVSTASQRMVQEHSHKWTQERMLSQRQMVRAIPVVQVFFSWKDHKNQIFYVYGFENRIHAPNYPQQCCCGCSLL